MSVRKTAAAVIVVFAGLALQGCKIVPIADETEAAAAKAAGAVDRATQVWTEQAAPYFVAQAKPLGEVLAAVSANLADAGKTYGYRQAAEGSPWTFVVSGAGTVTEKNTKSRAGTLTIALDGAGPVKDVTLQIGPVVRGNSVRDSLPFVSFKDFDNQLDYADMGKALNALALAAIEAPAAAAEPGAKLGFIGVISLASPSDKLLVTPVKLEAGS